MQLFSDLQEIGNNQLEDFHNDEKMKLSIDSDQHGEEQNGSALWSAMWKASNNLANKN